ncbi:MAG: Pr6Pr family membrane protein [Clostridiales Family XIII bacterium]|nr:Pr6Pr family membrane protein [Clostridiales Family XIII bacterium]
MIHNRVVALGFRIGCFVLIFLGLAIELNIFHGGMSFAAFMYYTTQSNLLALILFAVLICRTAKGLLQDGKIGKTGYFARFEMVCAVDLLLTLVVFWTLLVPFMTDDFPLWSFGNLSVHLIAPLLCLIDYILFTDARHLKYRDVYLVVIYPLLYMAFSSAAGLLGYVYRQSAEDGAPVRFPYFFFDFDRIGVQSILYIGALLIVFLLLSHGLYFLDRRVHKPTCQRDV